MELTRGVQVARPVSQHRGAARLRRHSGPELTELLLKALVGWRQVRKQTEVVARPQQMQDGKWSLAIQRVSGRVTQCERDALDHRIGFGTGQATCRSVDVEQRAC